METTLTILGCTKNLKVMVYNDDNICKVYTYPNLYNIPVYIGQKIKFVYCENRSWRYDDIKHKTFYFGHGTTHTIIVPLSSQGNSTLHISDKNSDWFLELYGGLGWIHEALIQH